MSQQALLAASEFAIENTTMILLEHYQKMYEEFSGRKRGILSRLTQPFKRIRN
jgi:hypothetical protein